MQPYFCPYIGYISLIKHTDLFVLFDTVQFIKHGWIERNRILKQDSGWQYFSVPLIKHPFQTLIKDVRINNAIDWKKKIFSQLFLYKKKAPYYTEVIEILNKSFFCQTDSIVDLNCSLLMNICNYLGFEPKIEIFSKMNLNIGEVSAPDEWALRICEALGADEYWNPPGGIEFFDRKKYFDSGIKIFFQKVNVSPYSQRRGPDNIELGLAIVDVLMFNSKNQVNEMLDDYVLL